jgi:hypothetical protein
MGLNTNRQIFYLSHGRFINGLNHNNHYNNHNFNHNFNHNSTHNFNHNSTHNPSFNIRSINHTKQPTMDSPLRIMSYQDMLNDDSWLNFDDIDTGAPVPPPPSSEPAIPSISASQLPIEIDALIRFGYGFEPSFQYIIQVTNEVLQGRSEVSLEEATQESRRLIESHMDLQQQRSQQPDAFATSFDNGPRYSKTSVLRGGIEDTFFKKPLYDHMVNNSDIMDTLAYGTKEQIESIPHFISQGPTVSFKCNMALETKLAVDIVFDLLKTNPAMDKAEVYRNVALLQDRACVTCKHISSKVSCVAGSFQCANCMRNGSSASAFQTWKESGMPIRHGQRIV